MFREAVPGRLVRAALFLLALGLAGCPAKDEPLDPRADAGLPGSDAGPASPDAGPEERPFGVSEKANLRFKRNKRLVADLARALGLPADSVCKELGRYDCGEFVHGITLGGVEPYVANLNEPLPDTALTTPIAVERVVLAACEQRVSGDLGAGPAVIFADLRLDDAGRLQEPTGEAARAALVRLYQRGLLRDPRPEELEHLFALYRELEADGEGRPARDWAILACFSVLSSVEALFY